VEGNERQNPLLRPLADEQTTLLSTIYEGLDISGHWPVWQYVELTLDRNHGLDAGEILQSLPFVPRVPPMLGAYYLVSGMQFGNVPSDDRRIGLTVGGMSHLVPPPPAIGLFMVALRKLCDIYGRLVPDPDRVVSAEVPLTSLMPGSLQGPHFGTNTELLKSILVTEPPTWGLVVPGGGAASIRLEARLNRFRGLGDDVGAYLNRIFDWLSPEQPRQAPKYDAPLSLPVSIEYLDEAWKTFDGEHLLGGMRASRMAILALDCETPEELDSRLSALCEVLNRIQVRSRPGAPNGPKALGTLSRLEEYLASRLPPDAMGRVGAGIRDLKSITRIRAWRQHGAESKAAFADLQLAYPPYDWQALWDALRAAAVTAFDAIREEVQATSD
jgi:hypothetical protein